MKHSALRRFFALGIAAFAAMVAACARGVVREVASSADSIREGGASGGDIIYMLAQNDGTIEFAHVFTNTTEALNFTIPEDSLIAGRPLRLLAVGGGGSGGTNCGGGGGAGGFIEYDDYMLPAGEYTINVGAGGAARDGDQRGENGGNTVISGSTIDITLLGGGGGGTFTSTARAGLAGGSGGGGSVASNNGGATTQQSTYSYGLGNAGGGGYSNPDIGGGGGGAGSAGVSAAADAAGDGGAGIVSDITGISEVYAAGGGGGTVLMRTRVGYGGGDSAGSYGNGASSALAATPGKPMTGSGGGGGAGGGNGNKDSAAGGSGVVVIRYAIPQIASGDDVTKGEVEGQTFYRFASNGTFDNMLGIVKARVLAVGGGGSGANPGAATDSTGGAGGGGAGGMIDRTFYFMPGTYSVVVGAGGAQQTVEGSAGNDGEPSYISAGSTEKVYAYGGGGGGICAESAYPGRDGGSGGGGSYTGTAAGAGGAALQIAPDYGFAGGAGNVAKSGAGGGGAGGKGADADTEDKGGDGGAGRESKITGLSLFFAAGGGGGARTGEGGIGGSSIGGKGASGATRATAGIENTGSGGGGGSYESRTGAAGGSGIVVIRIEAVRSEPLEKPAGGNLGSVPFDGTVKCPYEDYDTTFLEATGDISATDAGSYTFHIAPKEGLTWNDGTTDAVEFTWSITKATLSVTNLTMVSWQKGETPSTPIIESNVTLDPSWRRFEYQKDGETTWKEWNEGDALEVGTYKLRLVVYKNSSYKISPTWEALASGGRVCPTQAAFEVFEYDSAGVEFPEYLGYHTVFTVKSPNLGESETLANFPMLVRVSETATPGIYRNTRSDLSDIRFTLPDDPDTQVPFEIDTWNPDGESLIWVKMAEYKNGAKIVMNWGEVVDAEGTPKAIPAASDESVWGEYEGVWHFNEDITEENAATAYSKDSTANGRDAVPLDGTTVSGDNCAAMVSTNGVFGSGRVNATGSGSSVGSTRLQLENSSELELGENFTVSGWMKVDGLTGYNGIISRKQNWSTSGGWEISLWQTGDTGPRQMAIMGQNSVARPLLISDTDLRKRGYVHVVVIYDGSNYTIYADGGKYAGTITVGAAPSDNGLPIVIGGQKGSGNPNFWGSFDEFRIRKGGVTALWAAEEYAQATGTCAASGLFVTTDATFLNRWLREPSASATAISVGDTIIVDPGDSVYGTDGITWHFTDPYGTPMGQDSTTLPAGTYTIDFVVEAVDNTDSRSWTGLVSQIIITVSGSAPRYSLGDAAEVTRKGRIFLANDDMNATQPVEGQSYYLNEDNVVGDNATYWVHELEIEHNTSCSNLYKATVSTLMSVSPVEELCGSREIWHLQDVRIGNIYTYSSIDGSRQQLEWQNYLPQSRTAKAISSEDGPTGSINEAAHLVMRNASTAAIYSPCYTNGIGAIYFDAVNGSTNHLVSGSESFRLVVEVCTNTVDNLIPTDENSHFFTESSIQRYSNLADKWFPVPMTAMKIINGVVFPAVQTEELVLDIENGFRYDCFYRVVVKQEDLGIRCPARFRIRRSGINAEEENNPDGEYFLLVDSIEVSPPSSRADLSPYGDFDSTKGGSQVTGWSGAFDPAFPSVTSESIYGRMKADFYTNYLVDDTEDVTSMLQSASLYYRWRYLDQEYDPAGGSDWKFVSLDPANGYRTREPLKVPARNGDLEFWTVAVVSAPYYMYCDYTGLGVGFPSYSEAVGIVTNRCNRTDVHSKTLGRDWFVRIRDGASQWEKFGVSIIGVNGATNTYYATLADDDTWRFFFKTLTNETGTVKFRLEGVNRQVNGALEWETNTTYYAIDSSTVSDDSSLKGRLTATFDEKDNFSDDDWCALEIDALTGYLLFQIETAERSITIVHADYQNFNDWADAANTGGIYVGSFSDGNKGPASGTSIEKKVSKNDFSTWKNMTATNILWQESFSTGTTVSTNFFVSNTTLNGWTANYSRYVYEKFNSGTDSQHALQMRGDGLGSIQYVASGSRLSRGIDTLSFTARLANSIGWEDISYSDYDGMTALSDYTFVAGVKAITNSTDKLVGAYSISLIANYRPTKGCYEVRYVRYNEGNGTIQLWKWAKVGRKMQDFYVGEGLWSDIGPSHALVSNDMTKWGKMLVSVENLEDGRVRVVGALNGESSGVPDYGSVPDSGSSTKYCTIEFIDDGTVDGTPPLTKGTFGVASANCPAQFYYPRYYEESVGQINEAVGTSAHDGKFKAYSGRPALFSEFPTKTRKEAIREPVFDSNNKLLDYDDWALAVGRMEPRRMSGVNAMLATASIQTLGIYLAPAGSTAFSTDPVTNVVVASYDNRSESIPLRIAEDCAFSIRCAEDDNAAEVVIDDLEFTQWRGDDWENLDRTIIPGKGDSSENRFAYTNFTFTTCWVTNNTVLMSARRTSTNTLCSIVSPLMDGYPYGTEGVDLFVAGTGLGQITFAFKGAQTNANIIVQAFTNDLNTVQGEAYTYAWSKDSRWFNVTNFTFETESEGLRSCYLGMRGVHGLVRLVVDPDLVEQVAGCNDETAFGDIYIDWVSVRDEPDINFRDWWGWNVRTLGDHEDSERRMLIGDISNEDGGLSIAINNSTTQDIDTDDAASYIRHLPFVQSPTFGSDLVGGVTLKARKYNYTAEETSSYKELNERPAYITLYGSKDGDEDGQWVWLKDYEITTTAYTNLSFTTTASEIFKAFRFVVRGVSGVDSEELDKYNDEPAVGKQTWDGGRPVRIILDEMSVMEAIRPRVGFRFVGAFRSDMNGTEPVPNVPSETEQPLCKEGWGVQCEIFKAQLPEMIDLDSTDNPPEVILYWYEGDSPWGFSNWKTNSTARSVTLMRADVPEGSEEKKYVFRSSYQPNSKGQQSVVQESTVPGTLVQYMLEVRYNEYNDDGEVIRANSFLKKNVDWRTPDWYRPIDYNADKTDSDFAAYTILDTVAPHWAWINEVNIFGIYDEDYENTDINCQFVEIAVPQDTDLSDWYLQMLSLDGSEVITNVAAVFGQDGLSGTKSSTLQSGADKKAGMSFRVIGSPDSQEAKGGVLKYSDGTLDGVWTFDGSTTVYGTGEISPRYPIAVQLVRPRGILESEIVAAGTNYWAKWSTELAEQYYPENTAKNLNEATKTSRFIYIGTDDNVTNGIITNSLSVVTNVGGSYACWTNTTYSCWTNGVGRTPGHINIGQVIEGEPPSAGGMSRLIFSIVLGPHIRQWDADLNDFTTNEVVLYVQKNVSTNILYEVDNWQCVREVSCLASISNDAYTVQAVKDTSDPNRSNRWSAPVGTNIESGITVTAQADFGDELLKYLDPSSRYRDAICDWLADSHNIYGEPWDESDELYLAEFHDTQDNYLNKNLSLEQMYWLDISPTTSNMWLKGGMWKFALTNRTDVSMYPGEDLHNYLMGITMIITNANDASAYTVNGKRGWSPYVLRGVETGTSSWDYAGTNSLDVAASGYRPMRVWSSATFNITAKKLNEFTSLSDSDYWITLDKFVFNEDSFDENHRSLVEILDVDSEWSPAYWEFKLLEGDFVDEETTADTALNAPFFRWYLKDDLTTRSPVLLTPTNTFDSAGTH